MSKKFIDILKDQSGVAMAEAFIGMAVAIGVMGIVVQTAERGSRIENKMRETTDIVDCKREFKRKISMVDNTNTKMCKGQLNGASAFNSTSVQNPRSLVTSLDLDNGGGAEIIVNDFLTCAPTLKVISVRQLAFDNGGSGANQGRCDIEIEVANTRQQRGLEDNTKFLRIPVVCQVTDAAGGDYTLQDCTATSSTDEGLGTLAANSSGEDVMEFPGGTGGTFATFGPINRDDVTAAITVDTDSPANDSNLGTNPSNGAQTTGAIDLRDNASVTWGDGVGLDTLGMFGDDSTMTIYMTDTLDVGQTIYANQVDVAANVNVDGDVRAETGDMWAQNYFYASDERYKKDIETIRRASEKLSELRGVTYFMRIEDFPHKNFEDSQQIGLIAQEVEAIFPELVTTDDEGFKSVKYGNVVAILIEAVKEQMDEIQQNRDLYQTMHYGNYAKNAEQDARIQALEQENYELRLELQDVQDQLDHLNRKVDKLIMNRED